MTSHQQLLSQADEKLPFKLKKNTRSGDAFASESLHLNLLATKQKEGVAPLKL